MFKSYMCVSTICSKSTCTCTRLCILLSLLPLRRILSLQTAGPRERCVWGEIATEEAHGRPGHTGERDTAQDLQKGQIDL